MKRHHPASPLRVGRPASKLPTTTDGRIAARIREVRDGRDVEPLAIKAGISMSRWYAIEAGSGCSTSLLHRIAEALGVEAKSLFPEN